MGLLKKMRAFFQESSQIRGVWDKPYVWMVMACFIWLLAFGDYFTGKSTLFSDAVSYFDHTFYFIENIKRGVFPLWDSSWNHGAPNDFFLRRIGCYNPIYLLMALLSIVGVSHPVAYLLVHSLYFFLGAFGFYLLTKTVYKDERVAFGSFLLLLFSTVGTRIFDSYMCLVIVPTIWFLYFLTVFLVMPRRLYFTGLCLSFMIAMNTYIPLFFLTIIFAIGLFWIVFFFREVWSAGQRAVNFFISHPGFSGLLAGLVVVSLIPPLAFFLNTLQGAVVLPERHGVSGGAHVLSVDTKLLSWGVMEDLFFTGYFTDFRRFLLALAYVPFLGVVLWAWGVFCQINRRVLLYFSIAVFFILLGTPLAAPLHQFLFKHVFYFKYIRNLHFFLWFILLPLFIFISAEFLSQILLMSFKSVKEKAWAACIAFVTMAVFFLFTLWRGDGVWTTFFAIGATLVFSMWYLFWRQSFKGWILWAVLLVVIVPQAFQVFHYISRNTPRTDIYKNVSLPKFEYVTGITPSASSDNRCGYLYYSASSFDDLCKGVGNLAVSSSLTHTLVAYGRVEPFRGTSQDYVNLELSLTRNTDMAFTAGLKGSLVLSPRDNPVKFEKDSSALSVRHFDTNTLLLRTNFDHEKFLVYTDSVAKGWRAFVDGKRVDLYPANLAYKGVRVPSGQRSVEFRYGNPWWYGFNWLMIVVFNVLFYGVAWAFFRGRRDTASL
ncbi:MAG: hypothetical protein HQL21_05475 [Candidatus Omnitrophica bacterium]|nr:hypothetical protein [Candidatus Omnitrophota bacterium]